MTTPRATRTSLAAVAVLIVATTLTGAGPDVTVTFEGDRMTVTGPSGPIVAGRSPGR